MTKMMRMLGCVVLLAAFVPACGDDGGGTSSTNVDSSLSRIDRARDSYTTQLCECYADESYNGDVATCKEAEQPEDLAFSSECKRDVAECYAADFSEFANCAVAAISDLEECYASCPETDRHRDHCNSEFEDAAEGCELALPTGYTEGIRTCEDSGRFVCRD